VANLPSPVVCYAHWFSYRTTDFRSENRELWQAIRATRAVYTVSLRSPARRLRFVGDGGLDDQKLFAQVRHAQGEFVIRAGRLNRLVAAHGDRLDRWETEPLADLVATVPLGLRLDHPLRRVPASTWPASAPSSSPPPPSPMPPTTPSPEAARTCG
jgi:hypothetical protein